MSRARKGRHRRESQADLAEQEREGWLDQHLDESPTPGPVTLDRLYALMGDTTGMVAPPVSPSDTGTVRSQVTAGEHEPTEEWRAAGHGC